MAKGKRVSPNGESKSGWFRKVFLENRKWLKGRSNDLVIARWEHEHPGKKFGRSERNACNNMKSVLRKRLRKRGPKPDLELAPEKPAVRIPKTSLEHLEDRIDECMGLARSLDRDGLGPVVQLLRRARNEVVWKIGQ